MTKTQYIENVLEKADDMFSEIGVWNDYNVSAANEAGNRPPMLLVDFPDDTTRAYDIPYNERMVSTLDSIDNPMSDVGGAVNFLINTIKGEIRAYQNENEREDTYNEDDTALDETARRHSDDYYEDYDTDYRDEFEITAREWVIDHKNKLNLRDNTVTDIFSVMDFEELNRTYQNNGLSFADTMWNEMDSLNLRKTVQAAGNETSNNAAAMRSILRNMSQAFNELSNMLSSDNGLEEDERLF